MAKQSWDVAHAELVGLGTTSLHKHKLNDCAVPDGNVDFNKKQAITLVIDNRLSDPSSPVNGQIWMIVGET